VPRGRLRWAAAGGMGLLLAAYIVTAAGVQNPQGPLAARTNRDTNFVNIWGSAGLWLRDHTSAGIWSASPVAGAIAFYSGRNTIDMLGINDLHIGHADIPDMGSGLAGHEKQDPAYVLSRQPEYIMPYPNYFDSVEDAFSSQYITTTVRGPLGPDITWWERKDVAP
jgi:hypothetical protein